MFPPSYFAASYYPRAYFGEIESPPAAGSPPRDRDVYAAIRAILAATGAFADVVVGPPPATGLSAAGRDPRCVVTPLSWREEDDPFGSGCVRYSRFSLTLIVRAEEPWDRLDRLDRLAALAQAVLSGSDLGCGCLPALTRLCDGRFDREPAGPEQRVEIQGRFGYLIPDHSGRGS